MKDVIGDVMSQQKNKYRKISTSLHNIQSSQDKYYLNKLFPVHNFWIKEYLVK